MYDIVCTLNWTLNFRVSTREKTERELARISDLMNEPLRAETCERYWKIPEWWTCQTSGLIEAAGTYEVIAACLRRANSIAEGWFVIGPHYGPGDLIQSFEGMFDAKKSKAKLQSLEWAQFVLDPARP